MTHADRIIDVLRRHPGLDDDEIAERLGMGREHVNGECRHLANQGKVLRGLGSHGKIVNHLTERRGLFHRWSRWVASILKLSV